MKEEIRGGEGSGKVDVVKCSDELTRICNMHTGDKMGSDDILDRVANTHFHPSYHALYCTALYYTAVVYTTLFCTALHCSVMR